MNPCNGLNDALDKLTVLQTPDFSTLDCVRDNNQVESVSLCEYICGYDITEIDDSDTICSDWDKAQPEIVQTLDKDGKPEFTVECCEALMKQVRSVEITGKYETGSSTLPIDNSHLIKLKDSLQISFPTYPKDATSVNIQVRIENTIGCQPKSFNLSYVKDDAKDPCNNFNQAPIKVSARWSDMVSGKAEVQIDSAVSANNVSIVVLDSKSKQQLFADVTNSATQGINKYSFDLSKVPDEAEIEVKITQGQCSRIFNLLLFSKDQIIRFNIRTLLLTQRIAVKGVWSI